MPGTLYMVATPIGNLQDMTMRALETLRTCDAIACEDTRVTGKLLHIFSLSKPLIAVHEHSTSGRIDGVIERLLRGENIAYTSDAGTPGVNDPGGKLVEQAFARDIPVVPIPGPSALTAAISVCGFPMDEFRYLGFIPQKKGRETFFAEVEAYDGASVFFESTYRVEKMLEQMESKLDPDRLVFVGRELTKMHESLYRGTMSEVREKLKQTSLKGEFVIIVSPRKKR